MTSESCCRSKSRATTTMALNPKIGERLYVRPKKIRVFVDATP